MKDQQHVDSPHVARKEPQFIFVNISDPSQKSAPDVQRIVRSHTTHAQHVRRKDENWSPHRKSRAYDPKSITAWATDSDGSERKMTRRRSSRPSNDFVESGIHFISENFQPLTRKSVRALSGSKRRESRRKSLGGSSATSQESMSLPAIERLAVSHEETSPTSSTMTPPERTELTSTDASCNSEAASVCVSPVDSVLLDSSAVLEAHACSLDMNMATILDHFMWTIRIQSPDFELKYAVERGAVMERYVPLVLANPVLLSAVTLLTVSHLRYIRGQSHAALDLLRLRGYVLDGMHAALEDSSRPMNDAIIVSVAIMATYEALYGLRENHNIHMIGLARMIELRGGLRELGLDGLLDPLLLWYDANTASIVGSPLYLKGLRSAAMYRQANKELFLLGVVPTCSRQSAWT